MIATTATSAFTTAAGSTAVVLAAFARQELLLGAATSVILLGMWLCWQTPNCQMSAEEQVKNGEISAGEADRKIRRRKWMGPCVTLFGSALLVFAVTL